jgi:hypothetical protein
LSTTVHQKRAPGKQAGSRGLEASSSFEIGALDLGHGNLLLDARVRRVFVIDSTRHGQFLVGNDIQAGPDAPNSASDRNWRNANWRERPNSGITTQAPWRQ